VSKQSFNASALIQCIALIPVSFAAAFFVYYMLIGLFQGRGNERFSTALLFLIPCVSLFCLWVAILSDAETIRWRPVLYGVVAALLIPGCLFSGFTAYWFFSGKYGVHLGYFFVIVALVPGLIQLVRITRMLLRYRREFAR
jgi:hypothetical protein